MICHMFYWFARCALLLNNDFAFALDGIIARNVDWVIYQR
jgi:hypothetical protein